MAQNLPFNNKGQLLFETKDGDVFYSTVFSKRGEVLFAEGTAKEIWKPTLEEYNNLISELETVNQINNSYDPNDYTSTKMLETSEICVDVIKKHVPPECRVIFSNNAVLIFVCYLDSDNLYNRKGMVFWGNLPAYASHRLVVYPTVVGETPIIFNLIDGGNRISTPTGDKWYLSGNYDFSDGKCELLYTINNYPHFIFENDSSGSLWQFSLTSVGNYVCEYDRGWIEPRYTNLGLSSEYFRSFLYSSEDDIKSSYAPRFNLLISVIGNKEGSIVSDNPGGNSSTGGGNGDYDNSSDDIPIPGFPNTNATNTSLVTLMKPSPSQLEAFSNKMWSNWWEGIAKASIFYGDPADIVINLSFVPCEVSDGGTITDLKIAGASTNLSMTKAGTQYVEVDCGSIDISEYWGSFMDYEPFTKIELVLPYCGSIRLDTDEVMNATVSIKYHVDLLTGNCIAFVHSERGNLNSVIAQLNGNVSYNIPITGDNFSKLTSTLLGIATGGISTLAQNSAASTAAGNTAPSTAGGRNVNANYKAGVSANAFNSSRSIATSANAVADVMTSKPSVTRSGDFSANNGIFAIQYPYLIITRPIQSVPKSYASHYGHLSNITETLSNLSGYTVLEAIHLDGVTATEEEKSELESLLYSGVIL